MGLFYSGHEEAKEQADSSLLQRQLKQLRDQAAPKYRTTALSVAWDVQDGKMEKMLHQNGAAVLY